MCRYQMAPLGGPSGISGFARTDSEGAAEEECRICPRS